MSWVMRLLVVFATAGMIGACTHEPDMVGQPLTGDVELRYREPRRDCHLDPAMLYQPCGITVRLRVQRDQPQGFYHYYCDVVALDAQRHVVLQGRAAIGWGDLSGGGTEVAEGP